MCFNHTYRIYICLVVDKNSKADEDLIIVSTASLPGEDKPYLIGHGMSKYDRYCESTFLRGYQFLWFD
jgi:hypothetical protein